MNAKEYLSQAFYLNRQIKAKQKRLEWLKDIAPGPSISFSDEPRGARNAKASMVENAAIKVVALEEQLAADIIRFVEITKEIESVIKAVGSIEQRTILEMRYLSFMEWDEIASRMGYSQRYVFYAHSRALRAVRVPAA